MAISMTPEQPNSEPSLRQLTAQEFNDIITLKDEVKYAEFYELRLFQKAIFIRDVEIRGGVVIEEGVAASLFIEGGIFRGEVSISGGVFQGEVVISGGTFLREFEISESTFQSRFEISGGNFQGGFRISGGNFHYKSSVSGGSFHRSFLISGGSFHNTLSIYNGDFQRSFSIYNGDFQRMFSISGGVFQGEVVIARNTFHQDFKIFNGAFLGTFTISSGIFQQEFVISGGTFQDLLRIAGGTFPKEFGIAGGTFQKELKISGGIINQFSVFSLLSKIIISIDFASQINHLHFSDIIHKDSIIYINGANYLLSFIKVQNFGTFILNECTYTDKPVVIKRAVPDKNEETLPDHPQLHIINSDLGKTTLINCDLSGFDLIFKSSKITDVFVTGTQMPKQITTTVDSTSDLPDFKQHQLGYSQIKKIYEARGDRVEANRYYAREMEAYRKTLSWFRMEDIAEKINLNANKISTNYGQSWTLGLASTLVASAIFYYLYCYALGYRFGWAWGGSSGFFGEIASYFLEFLNPIHKADYVAEQLLTKGETIPPWARAIEGISRIFIAYFVYQLIQAFRKHGKSSG